jgi:hypothetical protein
VTDNEAQARLVNALVALLDYDDRWQITPAPGCLTATRAWPDGSADTLVILSPETAYGRREDPRGRQVWSVRGTVEKIVAAAVDVAPPFALNAPNDRDAAEPPGEWM